jgi:hypothetical protein
MGARLPMNALSSQVAVNLSGAAETILATLGPISTSLDNQPILLFAYASIGISGGGGTALTLRIRRGPLVTSPSVNLGASQLIAAGQAGSVTLCYVDLIPGSQANLLYTLTGLVTGGVGTSVVNDLSLIAMCM